MSGHLSVTWNRNFPNDRNSMSFGQIMGDKKVRVQSLQDDYRLLTAFHPNRL